NNFLPRGAWLSGDAQEIASVKLTGDCTQFDGGAARPAGSPSRQSDRRAPLPGEEHHETRASRDSGRSSDGGGVQRLGKTGRRREAFGDGERGRFAAPQELDEGWPVRRPALYSRRGGQPSSGNRLQG